MKNNVLLEYIWLDSVNNFRSKTRVLEVEDLSNLKVELLPIWNYDGSSTGQAIGTDSEIFLKPAAIFKDPFRKDLLHNAYLVWCEMLDNKKVYLPNSTRHTALTIFNKYLDEEPWFGLEQ